MPAVEIQPAGRTVEVAAGTPLCDAVRSAGTELDTPCGGAGTCGRCLVQVTAGALEADCAGRLPEAALAQGFALACRSRVGRADVTVHVPRAEPLAGGRIVDTDDQLTLPDLQPPAESFAPGTAKLLLLVPPPRLEDGLGDLDRVRRALGRQQAELAEVVPTLAALRTAAAALRAEQGRVTATISRAVAPPRLVALEAGDTVERHFALAVDVGTTTVAVQLIDLAGRRVLGARAALNGQLPCGLDVISRISYARTPARLLELRSRVLGTVNELLCEAAFRAAVNPLEIGSAVISGNTVMTHLLLGLDPEHLRLAPYTPTVLALPALSAAEIGLAVNPAATLQLSPCVGSYLGGDITAGLLCTELAESSDAVSLLIDIGTNGELVIGNADFMIGCACSAGPAFEGGGLGCGLRASAGAIDRVTVDAQSGVASCGTIGGGAPRGICGSGIVDLLASLLLSGWLDRAGRLDRVRPSPAIITQGGKRARYVLATAEQSATGEELAITEAEIDSVIRAKAAIYSAAALMLKRLDLDFADLATVYVAGGFGRYLDLRQAITIGLLPDLPPERFRYLGNASLAGSVRAAASAPARARQLELARGLTYLELSTEPAYMDQFTGALFLPHTDLQRFPTVAERLPSSTEPIASRAPADGSPA